MDVVFHLSGNFTFMGLLHIYGFFGILEDYCVFRRGFMCLSDVNLRFYNYFMDNCPLTGSFYMAL